MNNKDLLDNIIAFCPEGIVASDERGVIVLFNQAAENMTGYQAGEVTNQASMDQIFRQLGSNPGQEGLSALEEKELEFTTRKGATLPVRVLTSNISRDGEVLGKISMLRDLSQIKNFEKKLRDLSVTDQLTGLFNRRHFHGLLRQETHRAQRYERPLSLGCLDLDHFQALNQAMGQLEGDNALRFVAYFLRESLRKMDMIFRYGGDEFMIIMPETNLSQALIGIKRLREDFNAQQAVRAKKSDQNGHFKPVTFSMGVAQLEPGESEESLVKRAEQAMLQASAIGGNRTMDAGAALQINPVPPPKDGGDPR